MNFEGLKPVSRYVPYAGLLIIVRRVGTAGLIRFLTQDKLVQILASNQALALSKTELVKRLNWLGDNGLLRKRDRLGDGQYGLTPKGRSFVTFVQENACSEQLPLDDCDPLRPYKALPLPRDWHSSRPRLTTYGKNGIRHIKPGITYT